MLEQYFGMKSKHPDAILLSRVGDFYEAYGDDAFPDTPDNDGDEEPSRPSGQEQALRKQCGFSQSLIDDLKAHRHQITRAHLAGNFEVAFDLALYALCADLFRHTGYHSNPLDLRATECAPRPVERGP